MLVDKAAQRISEYERDGKRSAKQQYDYNVHEATPQVHFQPIAAAKFGGNVTRCGMFHGASNRAT